MLMIFSYLNERGDIVKDMSLLTDTKEQAMRTVQKLADIEQKEYVYELYEIDESQASCRDPEADGFWINKIVLTWLTDHAVETGSIKPRTLK